MSYFLHFVTSDHESWIYVYSVKTGGLHREPSRSIALIRQWQKLGQGNGQRGVKLVVLCASHWQLKHWLLLQWPLRKKSVSVKNIWLIYLCCVWKRICSAQDMAVSEDLDTAMHAVSHRPFQMSSQIFSFLVFCLSVCHFIKGTPKPCTVLSCADQKFSYLTSCVFWFVFWTLAVVSVLDLRQNRQIRHKEEML